MSIFDSEIFNNNLFFPRRGGGQDADEMFVNAEQDVQIHVRRYPNQQAHFSILYFHGNGEIVADYDDIEPMFRNIGCELIVCDYRGYGKSSGRSTLRNLLSDSHKVYEYLNEHNKLNKNHFIMGRSLGSAAAIELSSSVASKIKGVIIESGYGDPCALAARRGLQVDRLTPEERIFDNGEKIRDIDCPLLIMHGKEDRIISVEEAQENYTNAKSKSKQIAIFEKVGHNDILCFPQYFSTVGEFCNSAIKKEYYHDK
ncbi:alpha/beta hydrolase [Candidatus Uabimicrobium sp. HlEnr_7]|uniref:alpha/beta hydrolase n=1 Tax=Candidatus Uabimicrobium helgolandensis TaxID=3095367 RepID=UPI0035562E48